jgi:hypothetical protein
MFRRALKVISPAPARHRLRDAMLARDAAQSELDKARAIVARVQAVIDVAAEADDFAEDARIAAADAAQRWAAAGADPSATGEREQFAAAAKEAKDAADKALDLAEGAREGLPKVKEVERNAQNALEHAEAAILSAVSMTLVDAIEPHLKEMERAARAFNSAHVEVQGLYRLLDARRVGWNDYDRFASHEAAERIREVLERSKIVELGDVEMRSGRICAGNPAPQVLLNSTAAWRAAAEALLKDEPNAS